MKAPNVFMNRAGEPTVCARCGQHFEKHGWRCECGEFLGFAIWGWHPQKCHRTATLFCAPDAPDIRN